MQDENTGTVMYIENLRTSWKVAKRRSQTLLRFWSSVAGVEFGAVVGTIKVFVFQNLLRKPVNIFVREAIFADRVGGKAGWWRLSLIEGFCNEVCWGHVFLLRGQDIFSFVQAIFQLPVCWTEEWSSVLVWRAQDFVTVSDYFFERSVPNVL